MSRPWPGRELVQAAARAANSCGATTAFGLSGKGLGPIGLELRLQTGFAVWIEIERKSPPAAATLRVPSAAPAESLPGLRLDGRPGNCSALARDISTGNSLKLVLFFSVPTLTVTIRSDVLKKYKTMKLELQAELASLDSRVCITTDMWTSNQNLGYMAVTAHFIDASFNYKKKTISFKEVKYPHTGYAIEEAIVSSLTEWGIRDKLFTVTVDNASNNTAACTELVKNHKSELMCEGEHLHVRCCAHILNLLVQDGMRVIHAAVEKTRELLKHIDSSPSRLQSFNALALANGMKPKSGIYLDVPNRWNSTYKMLKEAMEYKAVLNSYANQNVEGCPTDQEWDKAASICDFLKAFEELTNVVSAHREPTAHKFLPVVLQIRHALKDHRWQPTRVLKDLAAAMHSKLDKYWDPCEPYPDLPTAERWGKEIEFNLALVIATILDPRRKGLYVDFFYEKVAHNMASIPTLVESANQCMRKYFEEYKRVLDARSADPRQLSSVANPGMSSPIVGRMELEEEFSRHKSRRKRARVQKSELVVYLEEPAEESSKEFSVLAWWKINSEKFPILSAMARDFLSIPLSTVASESAFSCGGRILGDTRSSLDPEMLEALVCAKDWMYKPKENNN
ncbi:hypothetical protein EJB05_33621, partial [Eragrostis curvula]